MCGRVVFFAVQGKPVNAVHIAPAAKGCGFNGLESGALQFLRIAVLLDDRETSRAVNLIRAHMFLEKPNAPVAGRKTIMLVQRRNDFFADVEELRFQADEHPRQCRLPRCLIDEPPSPVLQAFGCSEYSGTFDAVPARSRGCHVILQHIEMAVLGILFITEVLK